MNGREIEADGPDLSMRLVEQNNSPVGFYNCPASGLNWAATCAKQPHVLS